MGEKKGACVRHKHHPAPDEYFDAGKIFLETEITRIRTPPK